MLIHQSCQRLPKEQYRIGLERYKLDLQIDWTPGSKNVISDFLSRLSNPERSESKDEIFVLSNEETNPDILAIQELHRLYAHPGTNATMQLVIKNKQLSHLPIKEIRKLVKHSIKSCNSCSKWKSVKIQYEQLRPTSPERVGQQIAIDIGELEQSNGYKYFLVSKDALSKYIWAHPLKSKSAEEVAQVLFHQFCNSEFPSIIANDNGKEFTNAIVSKLKESFQIETKLSLPYHPQSNGTAETAVKLLKEKIKLILDAAGTDWTKVLDWVVYCANNTTNSSGFTASYLHYGRKIRDISIQSGIAVLQDRISDIAKFQKHFNDLVEYLNGQKARNLHRKNLKATTDRLPNGSVVFYLDPIRTSKAYPKYNGPFEIIGYDEVKHGYQLTQNGKPLKHLVPRSSLKLAGNNNDSRVFIKKILAEVKKNLFSVETEDNQELLMPFENFDNPYIVNKFRSKQVKTNKQTQNKQKEKKN